MSIVTLDHVGQSYGAFDVFSGLTGRIERDSKIGIVGPNGIGKTTLLKLLAGIEEPAAGSVNVVRHTNIGYLRQEAVEAFAKKTNTIYQEMLTVFEPVKAMERDMRELEERMADGSATDDDLMTYGDLQEKFEFKGGYDYERRIQRTLEGLNFPESTWDMPLAHLSGGQKTRALLARLLLSSPDLLILDEPTNHLDAETVVWLEGTLKLWEQAVVIVSHDRYFLDRVINTVWEMTRQGIESYRGNYTAYLNQREHRRERMQKEWDAVMERVWQEFNLIQKRGLEDTNAYGRFRRLTREIDAMQNHGLEAVRYIKRHGWAQFTNHFERKNPPDTVDGLRRAIKSLEPPVKNFKNMRIKLETEERSGDIVLRSHQFAVGYPDEAPLFYADDIELQRNEVAALIGQNGTGKSSLLKTLLGELSPAEGRFNLGANVFPGYFAQAHDELDYENTVIDELVRHKNMLPVEARKYLGRYLFSGDDVFKPVHQLSGGERGRLALAILALEGANFLLLDEPTNHLDIPAQEVLQDVLEGFNGTILLVSHDRYLVDRLATQIWHIEGDYMRVFKGTYQQYLDTLAAERAAAEEAAAVPVMKKEPKPVPDKSMQDKLTKLENQIGVVEEQMKELAQLLAHASAAGRSEEIQRLSIEYAAHQERLVSLESEWESVAAVM